MFLDRNVLTYKIRKFFVLIAEIKEMLLHYGHNVLFALITEVFDILFVLITEKNRNM